MSDKIMGLVVLVVLGAAACFAAYKHGPFDFKSKSQQVPPGWTPPQQVQPFVPPLNSPSIPAPIQPSVPNQPRQIMQPGCPNCPSRG